MKSELIYTELITRMTEYFKGDPKRIQHFLKVYVLADTIAHMEKMPSDSLHILKITAILHDIGIKISEKKYGSSSGKYQEIEGVEPACEMMQDLNIDNAVIERVTWLIAHHHSYNNITDPDHRILVEADFLVNMFEDHMEKNEILSVYNKIFRTDGGKKICRNMFGINESDVTENVQNITSASGSSSNVYSFRSSNITPAYLVSDNCNGCGTCVDVCPVQCIDNRRTPVYIRQEECTHCGSCASVCIKNAILRIRK